MDDNTSLLFKLLNKDNEKEIKLKNVAPTSFLSNILNREDDYDELEKYNEMKEKEPIMFNYSLYKKASIGSGKKSAKKVNKKY